MLGWLGVSLSVFEGGSLAESIRTGLGSSLFVGGGAPGPKWRNA